jgi:hypothetical protein
MDLKCDNGPGWYRTGVIYYKLRYFLKRDKKSINEIKIKYQIRN